MKIKITGIQRFSTNDGPGIRSMVYFAGCKMSCRWCHNPETQRMKSMLMVDAARCIGCMRCTQVCESFACYRREDGAFVTARDRCINCLKCIDVCHAQARKASVCEIELDDLVKELLQDEVFYRTSGGGVTLSGGEAVLQTEGCLALLKKLKEAGIHTALETAGYYEKEKLEMILPYVDLFLFDLKMIDLEKHRAYTGVDNGQILENFILAAGRKETILRVALIPGVNDREEFKKIIQFVKNTGSSINEIHILPFHQFGDYKYEQLGRDYGMADQSTENEENIKWCREYASAQGFYTDIGGSGKKKEGK